MKTIHELELELDKLAKEWSLAKLNKDKTEEKRLWKKMKEIQGELKKLEKGESK